MKHLMKSGFGQCTCRLCGKRNYGDCPMTEELVTFLYNRTFETHWKAVLIREWEDARNDCPLTRQARNIIGPSRLKRLTSHMVDAMYRRIVPRSN